MSDEKLISAIKDAKKYLDSQKAPPLQTWQDFLAEEAEKEAKKKRKKDKAYTKAFSQRQSFGLKRGDQ